MIAKQNQQGFFAVDKIAGERFAPNIDRILTVLEEMHPHAEDKIAPASSFFRVALQDMVQQMLKVNPLQRPDADVLHQIFETHDANNTWTDIQLLPEAAMRGYARLEKKFNARNLGNLAKIEVNWTNDLANHLKLRDNDTTVDIFHNVSFLRSHKNG